MTDTIEEIMTPDPLVCAASTTVREAAQAMRNHDVGDVLVESDGQLCGVVTDRDLVTRVVAEALDPASTLLEEICSRELATVDASATIDEAAAVMREHAVRRLPVLQDGRPVGVISLGDLAIDADPHSALADISAAPPST
jgi:CBS domain-containing protein